VHCAARRPHLDPERAEEPDDTSLDHRRLCRFPRSLAANVISRLEPTRECDTCRGGCSPANAKGRHNTLDQVRPDLDVLERCGHTARRRSLEAARSSTPASRTPSGSSPAED